MSEVHKCDACGSIRFMHNNQYEFSAQVTDTAANQDAVDIRGSGHLCDECAKRVARLMQTIGSDE